jgi:type IV pilus assembly protein PilA
MKDFFTNLLTARSGNKQEGFTLIELMIVIAIIAILASLALPAYQTYAKKAKFSEVVMATTAVKSAIDICYQTRGDLAVCDSTDSSPVANSAGNATAGDFVATVVVADDTGTITATGASPVDGAVYVITPTPASGSLTWNLDATLSTCLAQGLCDDR